MKVTVPDYYKDFKCIAGVCEDTCCAGWQVDVDDASTAPVVGAEVKAGEPMSFVQTYYGFEEVVPAVSGRLVAVCAKQGDFVAKGEIIAFVLS